MPLIIVAGGQYGGEGKGLISTAISKWDDVDILVKTGGPNSAHTYTLNGHSYTFRMIPAASALGDVVIVFPAGVLIYPKQLKTELELISFKGKIIIDPRAGIVNEDHIRRQKEDPHEIYRRAGSTYTGTGAASADRAMRILRLAGEINFNKYLGTKYNFSLLDTQEYLAKNYADGKKIMIEGCQGYGLSNYHGEYPYVSSRDNTVNGLMSQVGLGKEFLY